MWCVSPIKFNIIHGFDGDFEQQENCKYLFTEDSAGRDNLPLTANFRCTHKGKFREWVEVKIGGKWYVCSMYFYWYSILHVKYKDATDGWVKDATKTNQILRGFGPLIGFAEDWTEDDP